MEDIQGNKKLICRQGNKHPCFFIPKIHTGAEKMKVSELENKGIKIMLAIPLCFQYYVL